MPVSIAILLGVVEGLTEYLPVSSTGHLALAGRMLGLPDDAATSSFEIVIQLGAILAVVVHYRVLLTDRVRGLFQGEAISIRLAVALAIAFAPAAVLGLLFRKAIKEHLFKPLPIALALIVGGVIMIVTERLRARRAEPGEDGLERVTPKRALAIGLGQCLSLWPGSSRSMCTIVAGQFTGIYSIQRLRHPNDRANNAFKTIMDGGIGKIIGFAPAHVRAHEEAPAPGGEAPEDAPAPRRYC